LPHFLIRFLASTIATIMTGYIIQNDSVVQGNGVKNIITIECTH